MKGGFTLVELVLTLAILGVLCGFIITQEQRITKAKIEFLAQCATVQAKDYCEAQWKIKK
jgi:prepilin-type N-terminal cleavage/methylation domain-containing protein